MKTAEVLLAWFKKNKRPLPWRETRDPYRVWISEIMLQQTQVATVLPYYRRWLAELPGIRAVAEAPLPRILKLWEGLGYYRRARFIHEAAKKIVTKHGGRFPATFDEIHALPGVGRYTAGAIASIAFGIKVPVLDGNVMRVLARYFAIREPIDKPIAQKKLWDIAARLVPPRHPGDFNEALMELGATVCVSAKPSCLLCPLTDSCQARKAGLEETLPRKSADAKIKKVTAACAMVRLDGKILIEKRGEKGLWAGLWQLPTVPVADGENPAGPLTGHLAGLGVKARLDGKAGIIRRSYTDHQEKLHVYRCTAHSHRKLPRAMRWAPLKDLDQYAFPSAFGKIIRQWLQV